MSVRNAIFELTTGCELSAVTSAAGMTGGGAAARKTFTQPDWYDVAAIPNRVTKVGFNTGTLAFGASVTVDLTSLDGPDGTTVSLATLVGLYVQIVSATGLLTIGNAAANAHALDFGAAAHTRTIRPGPDAASRGPGHAVGDPGGTGWAVDGTHKNVKLENTHGSEAVDYVLYAGGR